MCLTTLQLPTLQVVSGRLRAERENSWQIAREVILLSGCLFILVFERWNPAVQRDADWLSGLGIEMHFLRLAIQIARLRLPNAALRLCREAI